MVLLEVVDKCWFCGKTREKKARLVKECDGEKKKKEVIRRRQKKKREECVSCFLVKNE